METEQKITLVKFLSTSKNDIEQQIETIIHDRKIKSILKGGKRLRAIIEMLSFKVCTGGKETPYQYQKALEGSVAIELAQAASLVHDDIIDQDKERRGEPSFYIQEGIPNALLVGHKMLAVGFKISLSHGEDIAKLYVNTWDEVLNGQIKEINYSEKDIKNGTKEISAKSKIFNIYNKIIDLKTASLFASACKAGTIEANAKGEILNILSDYGREIGLAYQLADDLVDVEHGEMIDSVIIPLLTRLENKKVDPKSMTVRTIKKIIAKNEEKIKKMYIEEIKKHVEKAERLSRSNIIPDSEYKKLLTKMPKYTINIMLKEIKINL